MNKTNNRNNCGVRNSMYPNLNQTRQQTFNVSNSQVWHPKVQQCDDLVHESVEKKKKYEMMNKMCQELGVETSDVKCYKREGPFYYFKYSAHKVVKYTKKIPKCVFVIPSGFFRQLLIDFNCETGVERGKNEDEEFVESVKKRVERICVFPYEVKVKNYSTTEDPFVVKVNGIDNYFASSDIRNGSVGFCYRNGVVVHKNCTSVLKCDQTVEKFTDNVQKYKVKVLHDNNHLKFGRKVCRIPVHAPIGCFVNENTDQLGLGVLERTGNEFIFSKDVGMKLSQQMAHHLEKSKRGCDEDITITVDPLLSDRTLPSECNVKPLCDPLQRYQSKKSEKTIVLAFDFEFKVCI